MGVSFEAFPFRYITDREVSKQWLEAVIDHLKT
jgi:hypothetical protein